MEGRLHSGDAMAHERQDMDSTLIRRGRNAVTFPEMVEFAETIERRPLTQLLFELPGIAELSETKFSVASNILRRRFRNESPVDQLQLQTFAGEIADGIRDAVLGERIRSIFHFD